MKKPKMQGLVMVAALAVATFVSASDDVQKVVVSTDAYNRLVFPEPYSTIVIPPEAELRDNPVPTDGKRGLLIRPADEADPFSIFIQLRSGEAFTVKLAPESGIDAQVFRYRNAPDLSADPQGKAGPRIVGLLTLSCPLSRGLALAGLSRLAPRLVPDLKCLMAARSSSQRKPSTVVPAMS